MAPQVEDDEEDDDDGGAAGWLTTWADMMSVLLTFFIVLQAFSTLSEKKFYEAIASIQRAFAMPMPIRSPGNANFEKKTSMAEELEESIAEEGLEGVEVQDFGDRIVLSVDSGVLFKIGESEITLEGTEVMNTVAQALDDVKGQIRIEGHTCDLPVGRSSDYENNWWLSNARAIRALEALTTRGFPPEKLAAAGYGEFKPVAPNDNETNRRKNRRVEFVIEKNSQTAE